LEHRSEYYYPLEAAMKAVRVHEFGGPEVLTYEEMPTPTPADGEVLVRVHAAGVNPPDWYRRVGFANIPEPMRPAPPPLPMVLGSDISGTVVALGAGVTEWQEGDEVFGLVRFPSVDNPGRGYAEYATAPANHLARKPSTVDHVQAAAVPMAGLTAYQFLFDHIGLARDSKVLVIGAAGGVGHFAVQLARTRRAHVIGVASGRHKDFLGELGAEFVDYTTSAVEADDVDVLVDTVGGPHAYRLLPTMRPGGVIMPVYYGEYHREEAAARGITFRQGQVHSDGRQLAELARLIDAGQVRVGIDSVFSLAEAAKAHERAEQGHIQGKIVLVPPGV
jgi:NADPH:quinone reductase-like Zn-dependent oxidoreductase